MSCLQTISDYAFRSIGYGPRLLPKTDITLCEQVTLIGSGMLWNIYFGVLALAFGFVFATLLAVAKSTSNPWLRKPSDWFIFVFRGSPLFIQFFLAYELFVQLPKAGIDIFGLTLETGNLTRAWAGALVVLFLNTSAYSAEIFYGALRTVPKGDIEAADAYGMMGWTRCCALLGHLSPMRPFSYFTPPPWYFSQAFPHGNKRAMRCIMRLILPKRPLTHSYLTRLWQGILLC